MTESPTGRSGTQRTADARSKKKLTAFKTRLYEQQRSLSKMPLEVTFTTSSRDTATKTTNRGGQDCPT